MTRRPEDEECALLLDGDERDNITVEQANRIIRLFNRLHLKDIRDSIGEMRDQIQGFRDYMEDEKEMHAQMLGGLKTLKYLGVVIAGLITVMGGILLIFERAARVGIILGGP